MIRFVARRCGVNGFTAKPSIERPNRQQCCELPSYLVE